MINKLLTTFDRKSNVESKADLGEKIGNIGLGLLRIGFGRAVTVEKISDDTHKSVFTKKEHSISARVLAVALFVLALPVTILLAGIGCIGMAFSKSHEQIFSLYVQFDALKRTSPKRAQFEITRSRSFEPTSPIVQERKIPPIAACDTVTFSSLGVESVHGSDKLFSDSEIVEKLPIIGKVKIKSNFYAFYTKNKKAIIQQLATRGCTAATAAMLRMDNGKKPDLVALRNTNLGEDEDQIRDIQKAGLKAIINSANNLLELRNLIIQNDSCIVSLSGKLGGHVIVVDEVSEDLSKIRLRDPYHGWEITVTSEAFLKEWDGGKNIPEGGKVIQVAKN